VGRGKCVESSSESLQPPRHVRRRAWVSHTSASAGATGCGGCRDVAGLPLRERWSQILVTINGQKKAGDQRALHHASCAVSPIPRLDLVFFASVQASAPLLYSSEHGHTSAEHIRAQDGAHPDVRLLPRDVERRRSVRVPQLQQPRRRHGRRRAHQYVSQLSVMTHKGLTGTASGRLRRGHAPPVLAPAGRGRAAVQAPARAHTPRHTHARSAGLCMHACAWLRPPDPPDTQPIISWASRPCSGTSLSRLGSTTPGTATRFVASVLYSAYSSSRLQPPAEPTFELYGPAGLRSFVRNCLFATRTRTAEKYAVHELLTEGDVTTSCAAEDLHGSEAPGRDIRAGEDGFWRECIDAGSTLSNMIVDAGPIIHRGRAPSSTLL
jgi:hypothetical protein